MYDVRLHLRPYSASPGTIGGAYDVGGIHFKEYDLGREGWAAHTDSSFWGLRFGAIC